MSVSLIDGHIDDDVQGMTVSEAIELVKECGLNIEEPKHEEVLNIIVDALEKQIPKKPIKKNPICYGRTVDGQESYAYDCYCPTCDTNVNNEKHHCPCGQVLDWSDNDG